MDGQSEAVQAAGVVGQGAGAGLEEAVWRGQTATHPSAEVSLCQRALLDRNGGRQGERHHDGGVASAAAYEYLRSERTTLSLDVYRRGALPGRRSQGAAGDGLSGNGAGGRRASPAGPTGS